MNPIARLTSIVAVAAFALGGAGLALASVGSSATDPALASVTPTDDATTDPAAMKALTRELAKLDGRSQHLKALLGELRGKTQQVSMRTAAARAAAASYSDDGSPSSSTPSTSPAPAPAPTKTHSDDRDGSYEGDDDAYENDHESDDGDEYDDDDEHEDDEDHGGYDD